MNARQRDKYCDYANCSHRVYNEDVLSHDPYFKQIEDYCKLGRYGLEDQEECRCYNCRHFTLSRRDMKKARELKANSTFILLVKRRKKKRKTNYSFKKYLEFKKIKL